MKAIATLLVSLTLAASTRAGVLPTNAVVDGLTIGEWTTEWWKWVFSVPTNQNPMLDLDGSQANVAQPEASVFFLAGVPGFSADTVTRTFTVPEGKYLLLPTLMLSANNIDTEPPMSVREMRDAAGAMLLDPTELHVIIDGVAVPDMLAHREASPVFSIDFPDADNLETIIVGHPIVGLVDPWVADGYWLMVEPLPPGPHVLRFGGTYANPWWFPNDVIANITVVAVPLEQRLNLLVALLDTAALPSNRQQPLRVSLKAAQAAFAREQVQAGVSQLRAFQNKLRAQVAPGQPDLAEDLSQAAQQIIERARRDLK